MKIVIILILYRTILQLSMNVRIFFQLVLFCLFFQFGVMILIYGDFMSRLLTKISQHPIYKERVCTQIFNIMRQRVSEKPVKLFIFIFDYDQSFFPYDFKQLFSQHRMIVTITRKRNYLIKTSYKIFVSVFILSFIPSFCVSSKCTMHILKNLNSLMYCIGFTFFGHYFISPILGAAKFCK